MDLSILSELTKSVGASDVMEKTRSKRTCVRVREEISKLEEILKDDTTEGKPSAVSRTRGGGGRGRGRGLNARASLGTGRIVEDESAESGGVLSSVKKAKKATYSQFTHKRRKRKRKAPEEGMQRFILGWAGQGEGILGGARRGISVCIMWKTIFRKSILLILCDT